MHTLPLMCQCSQPAHVNFLQPCWCTALAGLQQFASACLSVHVPPDLAALCFKQVTLSFERLFFTALLLSQHATCVPGPSLDLSCRDKMAERYSLLRKLTITEPDSRTLELNFTLSDKEGAPRITDHTVKASRRSRRLERISITPCSATEIKASCALPACRCTCQVAKVER